MKEQQLYINNVVEKFQTVVREYGLSRIMCVCGKQVQCLDVANAVCNQQEVEIVFSNYEPNPQYESVVKGVEIFNKMNCDGIIAIGGGSAIDVAKGVKIFAKQTGNPLTWMEKVAEIEDTHIPLFVMPTTAGTGSEATSFLVVYHQGMKLSIEKSWLIPECIFFDSSLLDGLPLYQKKVTLLDAFSHCVESYWSVNATETSREYAKKGLVLILKYYKGYLCNGKDETEQVQKAAYYAGKAINISKTTAAHALSYKITSLYGEPHGGAVARCLRYVWEYTYNKSVNENNLDLIHVLSELAVIMNTNDILSSIQKYSEMLQYLNVLKTITVTGEDMQLLVDCVNVERMSNHPITFSKEDIRVIYENMFNDCINTEGIQYES